MLTLRAVVECDRQDLVTAVDYLIPPTRLGSCFMRHLTDCGGKCHRVSDQGRTQGLGKGPVISRFVNSFLAPE